MLSTDAPLRPEPGGLIPASCVSIPSGVTFDAMNEDLAARVSASIRLAADFPRPGIRIRDISPVVEGDADLFASVINELAGFFHADPPSVISCIEAWGFIFGAPVAYLLGARLCVARRPGELPPSTVREECSRSYRRRSRRIRC